MADDMLAAGEARVGEIVGEDVVNGSPAFEAEAVVEASVVLLDIETSVGVIEDDESVTEAVDVRVNETLTRSVECVAGTAPLWDAQTFKACPS